MPDMIEHFLEVDESVKEFNNQCGIANKLSPAAKAHKAVTTFGVARTANILFKYCENVARGRVDG